jgi:hypothetical protein
MAGVSMVRHPREGRGCTRSDPTLVCIGLPLVDALASIRMPRVAGLTGARLW